MPTTSKPTELSASAAGTMKSVDPDADAAQDTAGQQQLQRQRGDARPAMLNDPKNAASASVSGMLAFAIALNCQPAMVVT